MPIFTFTFNCKQYKQKMLEILGIMRQPSMIIK